MKQYVTNSTLLGLIALAIFIIAIPASHLYAQSPTLNVDPQVLSYGEVEIGEEAVLSYTVSGINLISDVILHVSGGFLISLEENNGFQQNLVLEPSEGELIQTIFVKFAPLMPREYNGRVRHSTMGIPFQMVALNGTGIIDEEDLPQLTATPDSLYFGEVPIGDTVVMSYNLTGENLISNVNVNASMGYKVSLVEDGEFLPNLLLEPVDGAVNETIYVKFIPLRPRTYSGRICNQTIAATNEIVRVHGIAIFDPQQIPVLNAEPDSLYFGEVLIEEEMVLSYNLTGENLITDVRIRAPRGYLISTDQDAGYQSIIVLEPIDGNLSQTLYVKFRPLQPRNYFGAVRNMTVGATGVPVRVRGVGVIEDPEPPEDKAVRSFGNYPNPFNPETSISFSLAEAGPVTLEIFNSRGQHVKTLINSRMTEGEHTVIWNGRDEANRETGSGVYFYRIKQGKYTANGKMILMK
jgi:hypothetical protein